MRRHRPPPPSMPSRQACLHGAAGVHQLAEGELAHHPARHDAPGHRHALASQLLAGCQLGVERLQLRRQGSTVEAVRVRLASRLAQLLRLGDAQPADVLIGGCAGGGRRAALLALRLLLLLLLLLLFGRLALLRLRRCRTAAGTGGTPSVRAGRQPGTLVLAGRRVTHAADSRELDKSRRRSKERQCRLGRRAAALKDMALARCDDRAGLMTVEGIAAAGCSRGLTEAPGRVFSTTDVVLNNATRHASTCSVPRPLQNAPRDVRIGPGILYAYNSSESCQFILSSRASGRTQKARYFATPGGDLALLMSNPHPHSSHWVQERALRQASAGTLGCLAACRGASSGWCRYCPPQLTLSWRSGWSTCWWAGRTSATGSRRRTRGRRCRCAPATG
jgi:hypothetical protein